ncbi:AtzE family amidohydrolase [Methylophilus aquaticus]|uniref:AtzE family amidohydrolase n=1 Tax=Methylophilus aquaticus TaxID=1971610 RepID=A0ABT9JT61_9PROT|nr:AtzE family amidohydrolase [Methylophilus aquaticus]MDP8567311.1 AtzE family amidohydrolase [Methylophilus aquaticus]
MDATHSASAIASAVRRGEVSAVEVTRATLDHIAQYDPRYNSFTTVTAERALQEAAAVDAARARGETLPPLAGVPYAVKNLFDIAGLPTLAGSKINQQQPPASADAHLVRAMHQAGALLLGALNMDEYAYGFTTENHHYGPSRNPHDPTRSAGGSSGGSAAAVAAGLVALSLGSDTNGSVRVPSSMCGLFGLKPTYGALSLQGMFPFVHSFDHAGLFARSAEDLATCFAVLRGEKVAAPYQDMPHYRMARLGGYFEQGDAQAQAAVDAVCQALQVTQVVELPEVARARSAAYLITASEGGNRHLDRLRTQAADFDPLTRPRLAAGTTLPAAWYIQAQRLRTWFYAQAMQLFAHTDVLIAPATPCCAQPLGQTELRIQGSRLPLRPNMGMFTQPISFIGLPVVAVPLHLPGQLPIAVQLIGPPGQETRLLQLAHHLQTLSVCSAPVARN